MNIEDLSQSHVNEEGTYRCFPISWTVEQYDSGSVCIAIRFAVHQKWWKTEEVWSEEWPQGWFVDARAWVIKKRPKDAPKTQQGELNDSAIANLAKCGLWNGDWDALAGPPPSVFVHIDAGPEKNPETNEVKIRGQWINPDAEKPVARGGFAPADASLLQSLRSRFQSGTRAIAGGKPSGTPPPPPPAATPAVQHTPPVAPPAAQQGSVRPPARGPATPPAATTTPAAQQAAPPAGGVRKPPTVARPPSTPTPAVQPDEGDGGDDGPRHGAIDDTPF